MLDFSRAMNQSNPVFGRVAYKSNNIDLAECGYITPMQLVYTRGKDPKTNEFVEFEIDTDSRIKNFVDNLIHIATTHDEKIKKDSAGKRRGFLFVTVRGNKFLECVFNSKKFLGWANENKVGVYMTSSNVDSLEYSGGGKIKKAEKPFWEPNTFDIGEFIEILNDECEADSAYKNLALTKEETYSHLNILLNIEQLNTGINLPALNGVYISRPIDKDMPIAVQIPGRCCRPDRDDIAMVGNAKNCPAHCVNHPYVKPYGYIYACVDEFTQEEFDGINEAFEFYYKNYYMHKIGLNSHPAGVSDEKEPNNTNKQPNDAVQVNKYKAGKVFEEKVFNLMDYANIRRKEKETFIENTIQQMVNAGWMKNPIIRTDLIEYTIMCDNPDTALTDLIAKRTKIQNKVSNL